MKYIEELEPGDCFSFENNLFILTCDFKRGHKLSINLKTGHSRWIEFDKSVEKTSIYSIDENTNFYPINPENSNAAIKNANIS